MSQSARPPAETAMALILPWPSSMALSHHFDLLSLHNVLWVGELTRWRRSH
ncbi:hypothetical protein MYX75_11270 [Acidobacteria bacterium AH-259-A15]|nr:hypothetical protein [Acidobacteria bacterium AH-259-A15]